MLLDKLLEIIKSESGDNIEFYSGNQTTKMLHLYKKYIEGNTVCLLTESKKDAEKIQADLLTLTEGVYIFPEIDILKKFTTVSNDLYQLSIKILENLVNKTPMILLLPITSIYRTLKNPHDFKGNFINITMDEYPTFDELILKLLDLGYISTSSVESVGEYSKRGSIIDIYSPLADNPVRLDYFDDELDSIRIFDYSTQKSIGKIEKIKIYPTRDFYLTEAEKRKVVDTLEKKINIAVSNDENSLEIHEYLKSKIQLYRESKIFDELDSFSNYIYSEVYSIFDYLREDALIFFDSHSKLEEKNTSLQEYFIENLKPTSDSYIHKKIIDDDAYNKFINSKNAKYNFTILKSGNKYFKKQINQGIQDLEFFITGEELGRELSNRIKENFEIVILVNNKKQKDYIEKVLFDYNLYEYIEAGILPGKIHIEESSMTLKGLISTQNKFLLITPREVFKNTKSKRKNVAFKYSNSEKIRNYQDLNIGDYIVHIHHGIGSYQGIENIEVNNSKKDFLKVVYEGGDIIYVDIDNMQYIQKYMSSTDNRKPKLNKLGTKKWSQVKSRVKKEIENISEELIKMYIQRELNKGYAFSEDTPMQLEFEQDFLFEATDDQKKATSEIKEDMQKDRPMDRLLCGDVGFGKTEVAMRAAFKAVVDNKQVVVLVPTTLLAEQHFENFVSRFANFPVNIEVINRFKTTKETTQIAQKLKNGKIDIIIGTHKILNDKFEYRDLGLLIVDEEQRFGVKHKEKIKHLKNMVDVLTLSATPIPRTLHMSLIGIRDLSVIETPPINRQPIQTFITRENHSVIREAVLNEVEREGQVFYIYNKVESIEDKYLELKRLLPEINIAYAHGRMSQKELENVMTDLINKEYDMLITTTIIETGIDISNVNTLIVEDADKFGLSQLYQIRGRVGRSSREAYAYFMYKPSKILTENSEKRLTAIKNFTALGSGYKIAMQDLSIRGAGDTLGAKQHGFIDSVGYTLYSQMLEKEILSKKEILQPILEKDKSKSIDYYEDILNNRTKDGVEDLFEINENKMNINLNIEAYIPEEYISKDSDKLYFYKMLAKSSNETEVYELAEEMIDRFSDYSTEVENLLDITLIRLLAEKICISSIKELSNKIVIEFEKNVLEVLNGPKLFEQLANNREVKIQVKDTLILEFDKKDESIPKKILKLLKLVQPSIKEKENV